MSLQKEAPATLEEWAGSPHLNLTLVFTDIVDSTDIGIKLGDRTWIEDLLGHFSHARQFASYYDHYVVKVIGDSLMVAFRTATDAVEFTLNLATDTGIEYISIRAGINSGQVQIRDNDIYGLNVNFTSRVQHAVTGAGILVSNSIKRDYEKTFGSGSEIEFRPSVVNLKSFGKDTLWRVFDRTWRDAVFDQAKAKRRLLDPKPILKSQ